MSKILFKMLGLAGYAIQYGCLTHCAFEFLGDFVVCSGPSMEPTVHSDNVLLTNRLSPRLHMFHRGDIVIARCPTNPAQHICKRIIGLPGDRILTKSVPNNDALAEPHYQSTSFGDPKRGRTMIVPRGHVWIEGDNHNNSWDSRAYGPIPQGLIMSRAICKLWPLSEFKVYGREER